MKRLAYICVFLLLLLPVNAETVQQLEKQRKQAEQQLKETERLLKETNKNEKATVNKLGLLKVDIQTRKQLIDGIHLEISALDQELDSLNQTHEYLEARLDSLKNDYANLVRQTHYSQMRHSSLLFLLSSESFQQLYRRMRYLQEFAAYRQTQITEMEEVKENIEELQQQVSKNKKTKEEALRVRQREQSNLERDEKKQQKMLQDLNAQKKKLQAQLKKQQQKASEINKKIDDLIAAEARKKANAELTKEQKLVSGNFEKNKGRLPWPTERGVVVGQFGVQTHAVYKDVTVNNKGIYIQTTAGSDCRAVYDGEVTATFVSGGQNVVIVRHGEYLSVYSNLTTLYVKKGDKVKTKQKIGKIATDKENDNQTVLYFQIRKETEVLNPTLWLSK